MAYKRIADKIAGSESLSQALHFLGEKSASGKSARPTTKDPKHGRVGVEVKRAKKRASQSVLKQAHRSAKFVVDLKPNVIDRLADKLDVEEVVILSVSGISERTFHRRQKQGEPLTRDEADRVLRIARVAGAAERVFGDAEKSRRWLRRENALLGASPLSLLATDAGSRDVEAELMRIDWSDFA
jgi:putative toxin-antitoxin system antitoxin component (TIGR02293 family)